jgi:DNA-binding CsgD family transcriptional regulator
LNPSQAPDRAEDAEGRENMDEAAVLSLLIEDIYDAALDTSRWNGVLEKTSKFIDAFAVSIVTQDRFEEPVRYEHYFGVDPYYQQIYEEKYSRCDPRNALNGFFKVGEIFSTFAVLSHREMRDTQFYQEYIQPQGITDNLRCVFDRSPINYLGAFRRADNARPAETTFRRMQRLMPHVKRAALISKTVSHSNAQTATFIDVLDDFRAGIFLLDARRRLVHANRSGHALLARRILLRTANGCLSAKEPDAQRALDRAVAQAANTDRRRACRGVTVGLQTSEDERYVAHLLPLISGERGRIGARCEAVAALFVHRVEASVSAPCELIAALYNLTPMEVSVLFAIVNVGGAPEVAKALGVAQSTVKTHLVRVFAKTGTGRQADLVKLIAGFSNPLLS